MFHMAEVKARSKLQVQQDEDKIEDLLEELDLPLNKMHKSRLGEDVESLRDLKVKLSHKPQTVVPPLDEATIRSLRQISSPSPKLHDVLVAFFLLLGEYEGNTRVSLLSLFISLYSAHFLCTHYIRGYL